MVERRTARPVATQATQVNARTTAAEPKTQPQPRQVVGANAAAAKPAAVSKQLATAPGIAFYAYLDRPNTKFPEAKYGITIAFPKEQETPEAQEALDLMLEEIDGIWNEFKASCARRRTGEHPLKDGDEQENEALVGKWFIRTNSKFEIPAVNQRKEPIQGGQIYGGDLVRMIINFKKTEATGTFFLKAYPVVVQLLEKRAKGSIARAVEALGCWGDIADGDVEEVAQGVYEVNTSGLSPDDVAF